MDVGKSIVRGINKAAIKSLAHVVKNRHQYTQKQRVSALLSLSKIDPKNLQGLVSRRILKQAKAFKELLGKFSLKELQNNGPLGYQDARQKLAAAARCRQKKDTRFLGSGCDDRVSFMDVNKVDNQGARASQHTFLKARIGTSLGIYITWWSRSFSTKGALLASGLL